MTEYVTVPDIREVDGIFVYCDSPKHRNRVLVNKFTPSEDKARRWTEWRDTGVSLIADHDGESVASELISAPAEVRVPIVDEAGPPWKMETRHVNTHLEGKVRARYTLTCGRCAHSVAVREERLFAALDRIAEAGVSEVSLSALAAIVERVGGS